MFAYDTERIYAVRFIRKDNKPAEEYLYRRKDDAEAHFNLFLLDDSDLYAHIDLTEASNDQKEVVLKTILFDKTKLNKHIH